MIVHLRLALQLRLHCGLAQLWYILIHYEPAAFTTCRIQMHAIACNDALHSDLPLHSGSHWIHIHSSAYECILIAFSSNAIECMRMHVNASQCASKAPRIHTRICEPLGAVAPKRSFEDMWATFWPHQQVQRYPSDENGGWLYHLKPSWSLTTMVNANHKKKTKKKRVQFRKMHTCTFYYSYRLGHIPKV